MFWNRLRTPLAVAAVALCATTGCEAVVASDFTISDDSVEVEVSVTANGELAAEMGSQDNTDSLLAVAETKFGSPQVRVESGDGLYVASAPVSYDKTVGASDVTGVAGATIEGTDTDSATLQVVTIHPQALSDAIA